MTERKFWLIVAVGTIAIWVVSWWLGQGVAQAIDLSPIAGWLFWVLIAVECAWAALCGAIWYRALDPSLIAAASIAIPLAVVWSLDFIIPMPLIAHLAVYAIGMAAFWALTSLPALQSWWYRVVLRSRREPPWTRDIS